MNGKPHNARNTLAAVGRIQRMLCSHRAVAVEMVLLVALCMAGVVIPQQGSMPHAQWQQEHPALASIAGRAYLDTVFTSPQFLVLVALIGLGATLSVAARIRIFLNRNGRRGTLRDLVARRRLWGSLLFHAGLVGVLAAGVVSTLTRSEGSIVLTEGQTVTIGEAQLNSIEPSRLAWGKTTPFQVRLDKFHPVHDGRWGSPDYASDLTVVELDGREVRSAYVQVNEPLRHQGVTLYQQIHGFSPLLTLSDSTGRQRFNSYVAFNSELETENESDPVRYRDDFVIPGTSLTIEAEFFPDAYMIANRLASRSPDPNNPALTMTVRNGVEILFSGPIYLGQEVELGRGLYLSFGGLRYWSGFNTVKDQGYRALFLSAWLAVIGLCIRFMPKTRLGAWRA